MIRVHRIDSLDLPELAPYRTLRRQMQHRADGIFVAESEKVVRRLLASESAVISLLFPERWLATFEPLLAKRTEDIDVYLLEKEHLEKLTGFNFYQGVLAVGKVPRAPSLDELLARSAAPRLFAAVEGVNNVENLGGMVRSCAAFGVQGLLVGNTSSSPYLRRAVRGSMGTVFDVPIIEHLDLMASFQALRTGRVRCIAAHPRPDGQPLDQVDLTNDSCIVFGSEGYGISAELLAVCDEAVAIPMARGVDSLNVSSAAAVFLYEVDRQRRAVARRIGSYSRRPD